jgi:hypothetical protein
MHRIEMTIAPAFAALAIAATAPTFAASAIAKGGSEPGCASDRQALAHYAGGVVVHGFKRRDTPVPCSASTGIRSSEIGIVVSNDHSVLLQPAVAAAGFPIGVVRSTDDGATWDVTLPSQYNNPPRVTAVDNNMGIDRETGRIFWVVGRPGGSTQNPRLDISDDNGKSWYGSTSPGTILLIDHSQIFVGPPTESLKPSMRSYPNVVYLCQGSGPYTCQYSLDGGMSFGAGTPVSIPSAAGTTCNNFGLHGVVAKDGTLYVPSTPCQRPYVGISHDAGVTWQQVLVADAKTMGFGELSLGIDESGNLYSTWVAVSDRLPYLSISRDGGLTWGAPLMVGAPGVNEAAIPQLVAGKNGHVAIAYYGSKNSPGVPFPPDCAGLPPVTGSPLSTSCTAYQDETWDMYMTESWNALERKPLFWSASLNDPSIPTWYGCSMSALGVGGEPETDVNIGCLGTSQSGAPYWGRIDYFGLTMDADGTAWAGFTQECPDGLPFAPNGQKIPGCSEAVGNPQDSLWSMVGHFTRSRDDDSDN